MSSPAEWWGPRNISVNLKGNNRNYPIIQQSYNSLKGGKFSSSVTEDLPFLSSESQKGRKKGEPEKVVRDNGPKLSKFGKLPSPMFLARG